MASLQNLIRPLSRIGRRSYYGEGGSTAVRPTFDSVPVPEGSYTEWYNARNQKGNLILLIGMVTSIAASAHAFANRERPIEKRHLPLKNLREIPVIED